jgi:NADH dehydrogenase
MDRDTKRRRVVIVGGGFAGLFAARALRGQRIDITLIDRSGHHLFAPLLYQCATGIMSEGQIATSFRTAFRRQHNVEFLLAEVVDFDCEKRVVKAERPGGDVTDIPYDDLIVAAGVRQSYFGHDEFAQWTIGMKTLADALAIRRRVFGAFEMAESASDPAERSRWLTFALVGAGPTGVELAGQIRELAIRTLRREYRHIEPEDARVLLFDGGKAPLVAFGPKLAVRAASDLQSLGVELHMESLVVNVDESGLVARDHLGVEARYDAGTVLWTAGVEAPPLAHALAAASGAETDRSGRINVKPDLTIPGHPEIRVVGDLMSLEHLPGVAEVAMQSGLYAGRRIRRDVNGRDSNHAVPAFRYHDLGSAAYISRGRAVVTFWRLAYGGRLAWVTWLFIHIAFLTGFRNRVTALFTWLVSFSRGVRRERAFLTQGVQRSDAYEAWRARR